LTKSLGISFTEYRKSVSTASDRTIYITGYTFGDLNREINSCDYDASLIALGASSSLTISSVQLYAVMQSVGLNAVKNQRDIVLNNAGECEKKRMDD